MDKKRSEKNKKIVSGIILLVIIATASLIVFKNPNLILGKKELSASCMEKIATKECRERGFTHKYVVNYDEENNNLIFRCLIKEEEEFNVKQFVSKINDEKLKWCEDSEIETEKVIKIYN